jgi:hypothetical protein
MFALDKTRSKIQLFDKTERNNTQIFDKTERNNGHFLTKPRGIEQGKIAKNRDSTSEKAFFLPKRNHYPHISD